MEKEQEKGIEALRNILIQSNPILFLGSGFSFGAECNEQPVYSVNQLKTVILENLINNKVLEGELTKEDYSELQGDSLENLCSFVHSIYGGKEELTNLLTNTFKKCVPADFHLRLTEYEWKKIYTLNIDDLVENIYKQSGKKLLVQNGTEFLNANDETELIKLHGCVNKPDNGYIFSKEEYTNLISQKLDVKLNTFTNDIQKENIIFIGTTFDERDIDYYLTVYSNAGYTFRRGHLFFIDPNPKLQLRRRVEDLGGTLIKWNTQQFLEFISNINYNPNKLSQSIKNMNYKGIFRLDDIKDGLEVAEKYESRLYEGFSCEWNDIFDEWDFETTTLKNVYENLNSLFRDTKNNISCLSLYGSAFSGKSCLLKQLGRMLLQDSIDVLEYKGQSLNINALVNYIKNSPYNKFALLIDGGSYYYRVIEKLFEQNIGQKKLIVITTSRTYYHRRKRYYLEGHNYKECFIDSKINRETALVIKNKLREKGYLGYLSSYDDSAMIREILSKKELINLMPAITYGKGFKRLIQKERKAINRLNVYENKLILELAIFDRADIEYYPSEMLTIKYGNIFEQSLKEKSSNINQIESLKAIDYIKFNEMGLSLRNQILVESLIEHCDTDILLSIMKDILIHISQFISEWNSNNWRIIFESLTNVDVLISTFKFNIKDVKNLFYSLRNYYNDISYYWLQLGLLEQKDKDFTKSLNHLQYAESIRPESYQIQHAIARNYLKHANSESKLHLAQPLFEIGENKMKDLINSREFYKQKAKPYSIHCYINEKIIYIDKFGMEITNKEILSLKAYLDQIIDTKNVKIQSVINKFCNLLKKYNKVGVIPMDLNSPYFKAMHFTTIEEHDNDFLIDAV